MEKSAFVKAVSLELSESLACIDSAQLDSIVELIVSGKRVYTFGAGQAGLMMKVLAMMLVQAGFTAYIIGDVTTPSMNKDDVLIAASYSGTTKSTLLFATQAKEKGASIGVITADLRAPLADIADVAVEIRSRSDKSSNMKSVLYEGDGFIQSLMPLVHCIARLAGDAIGATEETMLENHANIE